MKRISFKDSKGGHQNASSKPDSAKVTADRLAKQAAKDKDEADQFARDEQLMKDNAEKTRQEAEMKARESESARRLASARAQVDESDSDDYMVPKQFRFTLEDHTVRVIEAGPQRLPKALGGARWSVANGVKPMSEFVKKAEKKTEEKAAE